MILVLNWKGVYMKMKSCKDNFKAMKNPTRHAQPPVHQPEDTDQFMEPKDNVDDLMRKFEEQ